MDKERIEEILESHGVINVTYNNKPVWIECISTDLDGYIQVKDLNTEEHYAVRVTDLKENKASE